MRAIPAWRDSSSRSARSAEGSTTSRRGAPEVHSAEGSGAALTTPFLLDYDLTLLLVPIAVYAQAGLATGFRPFETSALIGAFLLPAAARPLAEAAHLPLAPWAIAAFFLVALARAGVAGTSAVCRPAPVAA